MKIVELDELDLLLASSLLVVAGLVSLLLRLRLGRDIAIAATRMVVQLMLVGAVLGWVFIKADALLTLAVLASMILNAVFAGVRRTSRRFPGIWLVGITSVSVSCLLTTFVVTGAVLQLEPWYEPRYLLPLAGMVLGNTLTGLSLSLERLMAGLKERRVEIEQWLAVGATIQEATRPVVADALRTGMTPILNAMSVAGVVSLPGMMTGQLLAGAPPMQAVRYQIMVIFMIAGASSVGALIATRLALRYLITARHQLDLDKLRSA